jgi:sarcosine oxidase, subunit alpha
LSLAGPFRVSGPTERSVGSDLDRTRSIGFRFDDRSFKGFAGDTLASALLANGVRIVGRSFKFHRPRGVFTCGYEEPNALVQLGSGANTVPSARSTRIDLADGLEAFSYSGWPSRELDIGRLLDFTAPLWTAGFYNKTFMWPGWKAYEGLIRRMAGFGCAPSGQDPNRYEIRNLHCDVLVIGGGAAGVRSASTAAQSGARVVLVEEGSRLGGLEAEGPARVAPVQILRRTTAVGYYDDGIVTLLETPPALELEKGGPRERYWIVRAQRVELATGAIEQPLIFSNNDRPGILLAGAAQQYLKRYGVAVGRRVMVATNNDSAYAVACDLQASGMEVVALTDTRFEVAGAHVEALRSLSIPLLQGSMPIDTHGFGGLSGVRVGQLTRDLRCIDSEKHFSCDALAVSGGWNPTLHLYSQAGGKIAYSDQSRAFEPVLGHARVTPVGRAAGYPDTSARPGIRVSPVGNTRRQWVDLRHDVTVADLELALRENYTSIEHVKRHTTVGMSADQGKTSSIATLDIVSRLRGVSASQLGHTTMRPPFTPVSLGAIAGGNLGERYAPKRLLPMHDLHVAHGALMQDFGGWQRPVVYLQKGERRDDAIAREARAVRTTAGLFDASPLGKIEIQGPDALAFLDRFYVNNLMTLEPGRIRYGLMLRETGTIFDDGTVAMLAPDHLVITTTSGNASRVGIWLEEWRQCEWPAMRVAITVVTEQWAVISVAGPQARVILSRLDTDLDLSPAAFPHLCARQGMIEGLAARIWRVSFTGELTYEINAPANGAPRLWQALLEAGAPEGLQPFGLDALLQLRLEKGYMHIGTDTDGTTVPGDVGWGGAARNKVSDFVGKRSLSLPDHVREDRLQLVGLVGELDRSFVVGSHLRLGDSRHPTDGWITSAGRAVLTGEPIALALLRGGRGALGASVTVYDSGKPVTKAKVANPAFFDPQGERMHV